MTLNILDRSAALSLPARGLLADVARQSLVPAGLLLAACVARTVSALALPALTAASVTAVVTGRSGASPLTWLATTVVVAVGSEWLSVVYSGHLSARGEAVLRRRLVAAVVGAEVPPTTSFEPADLTSRLVGTVEQAAASLPTLLNLVLSAGAAVAALVALGLLYPWLVLAVALILPLLFLLMRSFMRQARDLFLRYQQVQAGIATRLIDALVGVRTIRAAGTTEREIGRVLARVPELNATGRAIWRSQRSVVWRASLLVPISEVLLLAVAGLAVGAGHLPPASMLAAAGYVALVLEGMSQVDGVMALSQTTASAARLAEVIGDGRPPAARTDLGRLPTGPGRVVLDRVSVRVGGAVALDEVSLDIAPGASVALVGATGAGKSVLAGLIGRLYEPDTGRVLLDGVDVRSVPVQALRAEVGYAFARPAELGETIADLIGYGVRQPLAPDELVTAARAAGAHDFIAKLPLGYTTPLRNAPLSGGEWQRLGLAQALARRTRVLILDDAMSSLDTLTEEQISQTLTSELAGRTRIIVARRGGTAARADLVVWLEHGAIRATGSHDALLPDPAYRALFGTCEATHVSTEATQ